MSPLWLHDLSIAWLLLGAACAVVVAADAVHFGFATANRVNCWLIGGGVKERM